MLKNMHKTSEANTEYHGKFSFLGLGRFSENCFLSFIEDNFIPIPCIQNVKNENINIIDVKQRSWKRRVNINAFYYFGILSIFAICNILIKLNIFLPPKENKGNLAN